MNTKRFIIGSVVVLTVLGSACGDDDDEDDLDNGSVPEVTTGDTTVDTSTATTGS